MGRVSVTPTHLPWIWRIQVCGADGRVRRSTVWGTRRFAEDVAASVQRRIAAKS